MNATGFNHILIIGNIIESKLEMIPMVEEWVGSEIFDNLLGN